MNAAHSDAWPLVEWPGSSSERERTDASEHTETSRQSGLVSERPGRSSEEEQGTAEHRAPDAAAGATAAQADARLVDEVPGSASRKEPSETMLAAERRRDKQSGQESASTEEPRGAERTAQMDLHPPPSTFIAERTAQGVESKDVQVDERAPGGNAGGGAGGGACEGSGHGRVLISGSRGSAGDRGPGSAGQQPTKPLTFFGSMLFSR